METGSLTNYLLSGTKGQPAPHIGDGITELRWTDREAGTIIGVSKSGKTLCYTLDKSERTDTNAQTYAFTPDPQGTVRTARLTKSGWKSNGTRIRVGSRSKYYDFSF